MNKREVAMRIARYSETLDKLNWISRWNAMVEKTDAPMLHDRDALFPFLDDKLGPDPITYLEFGVQRGNSMRKWVGLNQHPDSTFHGFDTFEGLPEDWNARWPKGSFSTNGVTPDIDDPRVKFHKGLFQDTLRPFLAEQGEFGSRLVINMDADLYSSTLYVLCELDRVMPAGTVILFDEFQSYLHEFRAWHDYSTAYGRTFTFLGFALGGVNGAVELT